jgi:hypothetical protein
MYKAANGNGISHLKKGERFQYQLAPSSLYARKTHPNIAKPSPKWLKVFLTIEPNLASSIIQFSLSPHHFNDCMFKCNRQVFNQKEECGGEIINLKPLNPFFEVLEIIANRLDFGLFHIRNITGFWLKRQHFVLAFQPAKCIIISAFAEVYCKSRRGEYER